MGHPNCQTCHYFCKTTDTCDYWLIEDQLRGCDPGAGCTKKITTKEYKKMSYAPKWDRAAGREMWLAGKSDKEIAAVYGVSGEAVGQVRRKVWEKEVKSQENATPAPDPKDEPVNCHENATAKADTGELFRAIEIIVQGRNGMNAVVTAQAVLALREGNLETARAAIDWLLDHQK